MRVAKSYEGLEIVEQVYTKGNNKAYCKVRMKSGIIKEVRAYTETEYSKMYSEPVSKVENNSQQKASVKCNQRKMLGFDKGYITIFKGVRVDNEHFLEKSNTRYHVAFGWYAVSSEEVPQLPAAITPVQLYWNEVGNEDNTLKEIEKVKQIVREKLS